MRMLRISAALAMLLATLRAEDTLLSKHKLEAGMYVWDGLAGGSDGGSNFAKGVAAVDGAGFHAVRLLLSPLSQRTYSLPQLRCPGGARNLKCLFLSEPYQRALSVKSLQVVMFTAYDFTSYPRQRYLDPEFLEANRQHVFDEYRDLAEAIMQTYSGTGRVFVISHWEGDNQVYCGSSYKYQTIDDERYSCLYQDPPKRLKGIEEWLTIRQQAIAEGRKLAVAAGAKNVEVYHAVEFNTIFTTRRVSGASIRSKEYKGLLDTVIPAVHPDLCSYSAWESANRNRMTKDLQDIVKACTPAPVIIGEIGIKENPDKRYSKMIASLRPLKDNIPFVFFWQAFEGPRARDPGFAFFSGDGQVLHAKALESLHQMQPQ